MEGTMAVRGARLNNPGCLVCRGTIGRDKNGFAIYRNLEEGYTALNSVLYRMYDHMNVREIFKMYAPWADKDNNPNRYSNIVIRQLRKQGYNIGPSTPLDLSDPRLRATLVCAISKVECGKVLGGQDLAMRVSMAYDPKAERKSSSKKTVMRRKRRANIAMHGADGVQVKSGVQTRTGVQHGASETTNTTTPQEGFANQRVETGTATQPEKKLPWYKRLFGSEKKVETRGGYTPIIGQQQPRMLNDQQNVFGGVSVAELREAGFSDEKIKDMQARIDQKRAGLQATLGQISEFNITYDELGISRREMQKIVTLYKRENQGK